MKMPTIWKYQLNYSPVQTLVLSDKVRFLHVDLQPGTVGPAAMLWVMVDAQPAKQFSREYTIRMYGTGDWNMPDAAWWMRHLGTVQVNGYVWHFFLDEPVEHLKIAADFLEEKGFEQASKVLRDMT